MSTVKYIGRVLSVKGHNEHPTCEGYKKCIHFFFASEIIKRFYMILHLINLLKLLPGRF